MKGRVVIIRSNEVAPDPRVEKEARALKGAGWSVTILGWDRGARLADEETDFGSIVRMRVRAPYGARFRNVPRKLRWNLWLLGWLCSHRRDYTHIHACDLDTAVPAAIAKSIFRKKLVYDVFDNIVLQPAAGQDSDRARPSTLVTTAARIIKSVENCVIRRADAVILVDESRKELLGAKPRRLEFVYNSPDAVPLGPVKTPEPGGGLRIAYVGQLSLERGLLQMLDVVDRRRGFTLELAGFGSNEDQIKARAAELPNVVWHGRVDYETAIDISRRADVLFATYDPALPLHKYSSANKLFEAMMLGKPIITARNTSMDAVVETHDIGYVVDYGNLDQLEQALTAVMEMDQHQRQELANRARSVYDEHYSSEIMKGMLVEMYDSLNNY